MVRSAGIRDRDGAKPVLPGIYDRFARPEVILADGGYTGSLIGWVKKYSDIVSEIAARPADSKGFVLLPRRWVVERTFAWPNRHRRPGKDYEYLTNTSETMIRIAMIGIMPRRLAPEND